MGTYTSSCRSGNNFVFKSVKLFWMTWNSTLCWQYLSVIVKLPVMPYLESKGWFSTPVLASHQWGLGSNPAINSIIMWVEFVVGFSPLLWGVPQVVFPSPQKATFPNSNLTRNRVEKEPLCRLPLNHYLRCIYLFTLFIICLRGLPSKN